MAFKFTIGRKIGTGFGILLILTFVAFSLTLLTIIRNKKQIDSVVSQLTPSVSKLNEYSILLQKSRAQLYKWIYASKKEDPFKEELRVMIRQEYPILKEQIQTYSLVWNSAEKAQLAEIITASDRLLKECDQKIMSTLNSFEVYNDQTVWFEATYEFEEIEENLDLLIAKLNRLIDRKTKEARITKDDMYASLAFLDKAVKLLGISLLIGGILIAVFTTRSITSPIQQLKRMLLSMGLGIIPKERIYQSSDEIGDMGIALNNLVKSMENTTLFAKETGKGNFEAYYQPLSEEDTLGHALLKMRDSLSEHEQVLERKVIERTEQVVKQKEEIEFQSKELSVLFKQVTDSIHYAKRIQEAILPPTNLVKAILPESFVLYKPKDIVSGDFYWIDQKEDWHYFAAVDCTGHGVPGAFMSIVGYHILKDMLRTTDGFAPSVMMDKMNVGVTNTLHANNTSEIQAKDGMDMALCAINYHTLELQFAGAFNPLYIVRNGELLQYKANKFPIGMFIGEKQNFTNTTIQLQKGDHIYVFSDGYADQFGGPKGKKFMAGNFRELLKLVSKSPIDQQKDMLNQTFETWRGALEQVDDILVIGVKV